MPGSAKNFIFSGKFTRKKKYFLNHFFKKSFWKKYVSGQNQDYFQIEWKIFIKSYKVSGQNFFPDKLFDKFPDKIPEKIWFQTKYGIFPDSLKNLFETISKLNLFFEQVPNLNLFQDKI